jgi:hypothetical protein
MDWRYSASIGFYCLGLLAVWFGAHYDPGRGWDWFLD